MQTPCAEQGQRGRDSGTNIQGVACSTWTPAGLKTKQSDRDTHKGHQFQHGSAIFFDCGQACQIRNNRTNPNIQPHPKRSLGTLRVTLILSMQLASLFFKVLTRYGQFNSAPHVSFSSKSRRSCHKASERFEKSGEL